MINWNIDYMSSIISILREADDLCHEQCFKKPTKQNTKEIKHLLQQALEEIEDFLDDLN